MKPEQVIHLVDTFGTPLYVYEEANIRRNYQTVKESFPDAQILYAVMCNHHPDVLRIIKELGAGVQINSLPELDLVRNAGFEASDISFTSSGLDKRTLELLVSEKISVNLDSVEEVEKYCQSGFDFGIRARTQGDVGIAQSDFGIAKTLAASRGSRVIGIHGYLGSNIDEIILFVKFADFLSQQARELPNLQYINFGSGFGLELDLNVVGTYYTAVVRELSQFFSRQIKMKIEPGRSIMASAGTLYVRVTNVKQLEGKKQVAVDAGFGDFARPLLYGAEHPIEVVGKEGSTELYDVRGNTVLQSDFLGYAKELPKIEEGDILAIGNVGAYGRVMASGFPGKLLPKEVMVRLDGRVC